MIGYLHNYGKGLLKRVGYNLPIAVKWTDDDTASTNGFVVSIPREHLGLVLDVKPGKRPKRAAVEVAKGLMIHEIAHHLQPLRKCQQVCNDTGLDFSIVNLHLDVQLERVAQKLWPQEVKYLYRWRRLVWRKMQAQYKKDWLDDSHDFPIYAQTINLIGRFRKNQLPYMATRSICRKRVSGDLGYYDLDTMRTPMNPTDLPDHLRMIADKYPELCNMSNPLPNYPGMQQGGTFCDMSQGPDDIAPEEIALTEISLRMIDFLETLTVNIRRQAPLKEALSLAHKLRIKLRVAPSFGKIIAPVTIDRRKNALSDAQPYHQAVPRGKNIRRKVTVLLDVSVSMGELSDTTSPLYKALVAVQAIALSVEQTGGDVTGVQFGSYGVASTNWDAAPLFNPVLVKARATSYRILSDLWIRKPSDTIIMVTDGQGHPPQVVEQKDYNRTFVISLYDLDAKKQSGAPVWISGTTPEDTIPDTARLVGKCAPLSIHELDKLPAMMLELIN